MQKGIRAIGQTARSYVHERQLIFPEMHLGIFRLNDTFRLG